MSASRLNPSRARGERANGWQDLYRQDYPELGRRWMANCEIPDLDLLPERYGIEKIQFSAGMELAPVHLGLWGLSWAVRAGLPLDLPRFAEPLLNAADWLNRFGSDTGGMHMILDGMDQAGAPLTRKWFIVASRGHGPYIPTIPAVVLARRMARGELNRVGADACLGLVTLDEYLAELESYDVRTYEE